MSLSATYDPPARLPASSASTHLRRIVAVAAPLLVVLAGLAVRLWLFGGTLGNDDLRHVYAAQFLFAADAEKHAVIHWPDDTAYRRMGVNLPLWIALRACGAHDRALALVPLAGSLLGIISAYFLLRRIGGETAALAGLSIYAFLPADVYMATVWLQDTLFAGVLTFAVLMLVLAVDSRGARQWACAIGAGLALAYLQYLKETAGLLFLAVLAWIVVRMASRRPAARLLGGLLIGALAIHALMAAVFWVRHPDVLYYWRETLAFVGEKSGMSYPLTGILRILAGRLFDEWLLGYLVIAFPLLLVVFARQKSVPCRRLILAITLIQVAVLIGAMRMTQGQDRYVLQLAPSFVIISAVGAARLLERVPFRSRALRAAAALALCGGLSGAALRTSQQQYASDRTSALQAAMRFVRTHAAEDEPIFAALDGRASYTMRSLYQFNEFRPLKGGAYDLALIPLATRGFAVLSYLERNTIGKAPEWTKRLTRVFHRSDGQRWASVYRIERAAPPPVAPGPTVLDRNSARARTRGPGRLIAGADDGASWSCGIAGQGAPVWIFLEPANTLSRRWPGVPAGPGAARARVRATVECDANAQVQLGLGVRAISLADTATVPVYRYSRTSKPGAQSIEMTFEQPLAPDRLSFIVPVVRVTSSERCTIRVFGAELEIDAENRSPN